MVTPVTPSSALSLKSSALAMADPSKNSKPLRPPALALSSSPPPFSPISNSPVVFDDQPLSSIISDSYDDSISNELALLESLRSSVQKNLALRPLAKPPGQSPSPRQGLPRSSVKPTSPRYPFNSARRSDLTSLELGTELKDQISDQTEEMYTPLSPFDVSRYSRPSPPSSPGGRSESPEGMPSLSSSASTTTSETDPPPGGESTGPYPMTPDTLFQSLSPSSFSNGYPLLLDIRPVGPYIASRIKHSINLAIPSLILKRCRKPSPSGSFAFSDIHALKGFVTTERGKEDWDYVVGSRSLEDSYGVFPDSQASKSVLAPSHQKSIATPLPSLTQGRHANPPWNGDIVVYDDEMDERDPLAPQSQTKSAPGATSTTAWTLLSVLTPLRTNDSGRVYYLKGGITAARSHPSSHIYFIENDGEGDVEFQCGGESPRIRAVLPSSSSSPISTSLNSPLPVRAVASKIPASRGTGANNNVIGSPTAGSASGDQSSSVTSHVPTATDRKTTGGGLGGASGLFSLRTDVAARSKPMPELDIPSTNSLHSPFSGSQSQLQPPRSPRPLTLAPVPTLLDSSPSPSPSSTTGNLAFPRSPIRSRSNSAMLPKLAKLDTKSRERLAPPTLSIKTEPVVQNAPPKLFLRTQPLKAATLAAPIASPLVSDFGLNGMGPPPSPGRRGFYHSPSPISPQSGVSQFYTPVQTPSDFQLYYPQSAASPRPSHLQPPTTPLTARPPGTPLTLESAALPDFAISTILPNFLFLGPEITTFAQVEELESLGIKRILNIAVECDDDNGLGLRQRFEKYVKIPMRDTVEEENVGRAAREVCEILDDARLHSAPTYVHCKAGKSRSVTMVMAYLIHANHWPLSRAYSFVLDRRRGISPNIGFVSELMTFEEQELGGKSVGVIKDEAKEGNQNAGGGAGKTGNYSHLVGSRRAGHARESLPPTFHHSQTASEIGLSLSAQSTNGPAGNAMEEMEIKDADGRYRHARRAPVDEQTLQPLRRVSKAGLETSWM